MAELFLVLCFLTGGFVQKWYIPQGVGLAPTVMQICDTDRDGCWELIFTPYSGPSYIYYYELHLPNTWDKDSALLPGGDLLWTSGDFDGDGLHDLCLKFHIENPSLADGIMVFESPDSFSYPTQEVWRDTVGQAAVVPIQTYDVDRDGIPEIFYKNGNGQPHWIWVYESYGNNQYDTICTFNPVSNGLPQSSISTNAFGDFDEDGKIEFAMGDLGSSQTGAAYWVFESPGDNTYQQIYQDYVPTLNVKDCFTVPDADGDGKLEFVVKGYVVPDARIDCFIFEATGNNTYQIIKSFTFTGGHPWYGGGYSDAGDLDRDGIPEICLEACQNVYIIKSASNDSFYLWQTIGAYYTGSSVRITNDIDGNGYNEIVISGNNQTIIYEYRPESIVENQKQKNKETVKLDIYPNPGDKVFTVKYAISCETPVNLSLYDATGRLVRVLVNEVQKPGSYQRILDLSELAQGVYFVRLSADNQTVVQKLILLR